MATISQPGGGDNGGETNALDWNNTTAFQFHFIPSESQIAGTGNIEDLSDRGWVVTSLAFVEGTGADFLSAADPGMPGHYVTDAALDLIQSPAMFGGSVHATEAGHHLGRQPTQMIIEVHGKFSVVANDEAATGFGIVQNGGSVIEPTDAIAMIVSDGTNFLCRSSADSDVGALVDTDLHEFKIIISQGTTDAIEWFIDGVSQGTLDLLTDVFPFAWGGGVMAAGVNRILIGPAEIEYC
jgi:hypothetical protein